MLFDLRDIDYTFAAKYPALRGINLKIEAGERLVILGANGCGKSTLLHILDGLLFPTAGEVWAFGRRLTEEVFQDASFTAFFPPAGGVPVSKPRCSALLPDRSG